MKKQTTSERLQAYMDMYNLRQVDILEMAKPHTHKYNIKLNKNDLSQYVSGKVEPGQGKVFILSKALNADPAWIMGLDVPMRETKEHTSSWRLLRRYYVKTQINCPLVFYFPLPSSTLTTIQTLKLSPCWGVCILEPALDTPVKLENSPVP